MHSYQIDENINTFKVITGIIISIVLAYILHAILLQWPFLSSWWWLDYPSVFGFYGIFMGFYNKYFWKSNLVQKLDWLWVPNLAGSWDAEIKTSADQFEVPRLCKVFIRQTGSKISISLENETSISHSIHAAILRVEKLHFHELIFNYLNNPKGDSAASLHIHYGTAWLRISDKECDGEYFTGRGRETHGRLKLLNRN